MTWVSHFRERPLVAVGAGRGPSFATGWIRRRWSRRSCRESRSMAAGRMSHRSPAEACTCRAFRRTPRKISSTSSRIRELDRAIRCHFLPRAIRPVGFRAVTRRENSPPSPGRAADTREACRCCSPAARSDSSVTRSNIALGSPVTVCPEANRPGTIEGRACHPRCLISLRGCQFFGFRRAGRCQPPGVMSDTSPTSPDYSHSLVARASCP